MFGAYLSDLNATIRVRSVFAMTSRASRRIWFIRSPPRTFGSDTTSSTRRTRDESHRLCRGSGRLRRIFSNGVCRSKRRQIYEARSRTRVCRCHSPTSIDLSTELGPASVDRMHENCILRVHRRFARHHRRDHSPGPFLVTLTSASGPDSRIVPRIDKGALVLSELRHARYNWLGAQFNTKLKYDRITCFYHHRSHVY